MRPPRPEVGQQLADPVVIARITTAYAAVRFSMSIAPRPTALRSMISAANGSSAPAGRFHGDHVGVTDEGEGGRGGVGAFDAHDERGATGMRFDGDAFET